MSDTNTRLDGSLDDNLSGGSTNTYLHKKLLHNMKNKYGKKLRSSLERIITKRKKQSHLKKTGGSNPRAQYYGKKSKVMVPVPENVKNTALYSYKLKNLGFRGGLETGWKRAKQLSTKSSIPIRDLRYMHAWFSRHIYTSYPSYKKWKNAGKPKDSSWHNKRGIIAWLIWGGSPAFNWVNNKVGLLNKTYPGKNFSKIRVKL